ncbi:hypothetical protein P2H44_22355 [Albimonas sp. CAU 1670]|uniref:hypothetical protein n=1 Tax=Albimonas sp. CAU 1670 TaxID=3032599 RepID=UPI0023DC9F78|nr:hypothetical protein [Albimonas sp. CAU 1670]MDF2235310.1 hypothetical protein [Albimonas sp. CAU 1670]
MTDDPVDLDARRTATGQMAAAHRRHALRDFEAAQETLRRRQEELEAQLMAEPAETWPEAAVKAQYLIRLFARTGDAQDPRRRKLVERALGDIARLLEREEDAT